MSPDQYIVISYLSRVRHDERHHISRCLEPQLTSISLAPMVLRN